jgi:two-component system sensor histidine kinase PilS (NtrC family)
VDTTIVPFLDARGKPSRYLAIRTDITESKKAQEALLEKEASAALARLGEMAAVVAHEVRNPLAGIAGAIQVLEGRLPEGSPDRDVLGSILGRIGDLSEMIQDFLSFARPRPLHRAPVPLQPLLREAAASLTDAAEYSGVLVEVSGADVTVSGDADLLRGAFANILLNAGQAMSGRGTVRASVRGMDGCCLVSIHDDGPGIPAEARERVFELFFTTKNRGTGLGLPIVRRDVEAHGGEVAVTCPPGGGTNVLVMLPLGVQ